MVSKKENATRLQCFPFTASHLNLKSCVLASILKENIAQTIWLLKGKSLEICRWTAVSWNYTMLERLLVALKLSWVPL